MSYDTIESSHEDGRPIYGYLFTLGTTIWRYTSHSNDFMDSEGKLWTAVAISDDGIKQTGEATTDALSIRAPITIGPVQEHMTTPPSQPIQLAICRTHVGDVDNQMVVVYTGEISQVNPVTAGQATMQCQTTSASMQRDGLRLGWQRGCPYALYDELTCKVDKTVFAEPLRILSISGFTVTTDAAGEHDDNYFSGGFIEWQHPVRGTEFRGIEKHVGNVLTVFGMTDDLYEGLTLTAYPGCTRTVTSCSGKFDNLLNYGGIPHLPGKSPFDGNPVF
jgi:uncharacterized phage protein (TIGR02218 family)